MLIAVIGVIIGIVLIVVLTRRNRKSSPPPAPAPLPVPAPSPEPVPTPQPEPQPLVYLPDMERHRYPTPEILPGPFIKRVIDRDVIITARRDSDLGKLITETSAALGSERARIIIRGEDSSPDAVYPIRTNAVTRHHLFFERGVYSADIEDIWRGAILMHDGVLIDSDGAVFLEPNFVSSFQPAIAVFQGFNGSLDNYAANRDLTVMNVKIVGRQKVTDGGVRQAISLGNCSNCAVIGSDLDDVASIGIQFGGGAARGNSARNVLVWKNRIKKNAAAAIALVNVDGAIVAFNEMSEPGRMGGPGGVSAIDIESNNLDDYVRDIKIFDNVIRYAHAGFFGVGNGILGQNVYNTDKSTGLLIANNVIDGFEGERNTEKWGLTNGLYFVGQFREGLVTNNVVVRGLQHAVLGYNLKGLTFTHNHTISSGGGGNVAVRLVAGGENVFRNNELYDLNIPGSSVANIWEDDSFNNIFEGNICNGEPCAKG